MRPQQQPLLLLGLLFGLLLVSTQAFVSPLKPPQIGSARSAAPRTSGRPPPTKMMLEPASLDAGASVLLAAEAWVAPARTVTETVLDLGGIAFLIRIILSWYPQVNLNKLPANIIAWPTEPFLAATRVVVPPAFGVDISPIIWFAFLNFLRETLTSDQGLLTLLLQK